MRQSDWVEHRRAGDREVVGWLRPDGEGFVAVDRLGREVTGVVDRLDAEEALEAHGLRWLADLWELVHDDGATTRVRIVEVVADRVVVKADDLGDITAEQRTWTLPFPPGESLRLFSGDPSVIEGFPPGR